MAAKIKKGDKVVILAGRDKGRTGEVIKVMPDENRALVRGLLIALVIPALFTVIGPRIWWPARLDSA